MNILKKLIPVFLILTLLLGMLPGAAAEDAAEQESDDARFKDKTWDEVIADFMEERGLTDGTFALGYCNLVTGEEHYYNGDTYITSGSMYKVPLNMIFAEKIANGEMTLDSDISGYKYSYLLESTIINSNNENAKILWDSLGSYHNYRRLIAPYMGEDPDNVDDKFYENNFNTARQYVTCLKLLYNEQERFPNIIDTMLRAEPNKYFRRDEDRFTIAHKYGYLDDSGHFYLNDCGIVWTDDPIVIVMYTDNAENPYGALATYCTLMCDYTQYNTALRHQQEAEAAAQAEAEAEAAAIAEAQQQAREQMGIAEESAVPDTEPTAVDTESSVPESVESAEVSNASALNAVEESSVGIPQMILCMAIALIALVLVAGIVSARIRKHRAGKIMLALVVSAVVFAGAFILGEQTAKEIPEADPQETINSFFDELIIKDYETAYSYLENYTTLGLENKCDNENAETVMRAIRASYRCELIGDSIKGHSSAVQTVQLTYLDISKLQSAITDILAQAEDSSYTEALNTALEDRDSLLTNKALNITLTYHSKAWHIIADDALLACLAGGQA